MTNGGVEVAKRVAEIKRGSEKSHIKLLSKHSLQDEAIVVSYSQKEQARSASESERKVREGVKVAGRRAAVGSVLVADRSERIRQDLKDLLDASGYYQVIGEAGTLAETVELAAAVNPEVLLFDMDLVDEDGLNVIRGLRKLLPAAAVIVTHSDGHEYDTAAREAGASACVAKARLFETIGPALQTAIKEVEETEKRNGGYHNAPRPARTSPRGRRHYSASFTPRTRLWWKPRGWREWLAGVVAFGWAMVRGAPIDSAPERSYWKHVEAAMVLMIGVLLIGLLEGQFSRVGDLTRGLVVVALLVLTGAQARQIRRFSSERQRREDI